MPSEILLKNNPKIVLDQEKVLFIHQGALGDQLLSLPLLKELQLYHSLSYAGRGIGLSLIKKLLPLTSSFNLDSSPQQLQTWLQSNKPRKIISVGSINWLNLKFPCETIELKTTGSFSKPIWKTWAEIALHREISPFYFSKPLKSNEPCLIIAPGSGSPAKNWPFENYIEVAEALSSQYRVHFLLGPAELEREVTHDWARQKHFFEISIEPNTEELIELYRKATHFLGNDSGPGHLASVFNLKGLIIFLKTPSDIWSPYGEDLQCVDGSTALELIISHFKSFL